MPVLPVLALALALAAAPERARVEQTIGDAKREALVYPSKPAPVVFVFHGHGGTMRHAARSIPVHARWPAAVVADPQGLNSPVPLVDREGNQPGRSGAVTRGTATSRSSTPCWAGCSAARTGTSRRTGDARSTMS